MFKWFKKKRTIESVNEKIIREVEADLKELWGWRNAFVPKGESFNEHFKRKLDLEDIYKAELDARKEQEEAAKVK